MAEKRRTSAGYRFRLYLRSLEVCVAQTVVYCPPVHPHDLCMYIRYIHPLTIDCQHETGFTGCHTDNPAITPSETRLSIALHPSTRTRTRSLAKFQQLNILYFFMDIYVCAARRSSIL